MMPFSICIHPSDCYLSEREQGGTGEGGCVGMQEGVGEKQTSPYTFILHPKSLNIHNILLFLLGTMGKALNFTRRICPKLNKAHTYPGTIFRESALRPVAMSIYLSPFM